MSLDPLAHSRARCQMVQFIKQEAEEKAHEISVAAEEVRPLTSSQQVPRL